MPYIKQEQRTKLETRLQGLVDTIVELIREESMSALPGVLNYTITSLIKRSYTQFLEAECHEAKNKKLSYHDYNDMIGILECAKLELYRRQAAPYEDIKVKENGDV